LQTGSGSGRIAACWYTGTTFSFNVNITDGNSHQLSLYALDWDGFGGGRAETIQIVDATTNAVLDTRNVSSFTGGIYLEWNVSGHVIINVTLTSGGNAVLSGVFFGGAGTSGVPAVASFTGTDATTEGSWIGLYGTDGYSIANSSQSIPAYATFAVGSEQNFTWAPTSSDPRALETGVGSTRIAACWFSASTFTFDINLTDGLSHSVGIYALDWDSYGGPRAETIQIVSSATNAVLDTRSISNFQNGLYLFWNITGHVKINIIYTGVGSGNGVISGVFFK
jgi:hypothetical protein